MAGTGAGGAGGMTAGSGGTATGTGSSGAGPGGSSTAGAGGTAGGSAGAKDSRDGGASADSGAGQTGAADLGYILGPPVDNQAPITVGVAHAGFDSGSGPVEFARFLGGQASSFLSDADGNLFVATSGTFGSSQLIKVGASLSTTPVWSISLSGSLGVLEATFGASISQARIAPTSFSMAPDGGVFFGGNAQAALPGETAVAGGSVIGKLTSSGTLSWVHQWGSSGSSISVDLTTITLATSDGGVIAAGISGAQAPGNPPTVARGWWTARYDAGGTRSWLKQYVPWGSNIGPRNLFVDAAGNIEVFESTRMLKVDAQGTEISRSKENSLFPVPSGLLSVGYLPIATNATKDAFYSWGFASYFPSGSSSMLALALEKITLDGNLTSFRRAEPQRSAVIDAVEGVIWHGDLPNRVGPPGQYLLAVGTDAVYLTGKYGNTYMNGSAPPPLTTPMFVGRYDLSGNRVWFRELFLENEGASGNYSSIGGILLDRAGNATILASYSTSLVPGVGNVFIFKLSAADGSILN